MFVCVCVLFSCILVSFLIPYHHHQSDNIIVTPPTDCIGIIVKTILRYISVEDTKHKHFDKAANNTFDPMLVRH